MEKDTGESLCTRYSELNTIKMTWNSSWQDVVDYVLPRRQGFSSIRSEGQDVSQKIWDTTAPWALDQLAAGLHSFLTSAEKRWFKLTLPADADPELLDDEEVVAWLENTTNEMYRVFNSQKSNFTTQAHELYLDVPAFGSGVMYVEEDYDEFPVRFCTYHLGECVFAENAYGIVDELYRRFELPAAKALDRYKDKTPAVVKEMAAKDPGKKYWFLHCVKKRPDYKKGMLGGVGKVYGAYTVLEETKEIFVDSGYNEFPYMVPRWSKLTGETYGRGPAMLAMPDIKMVNSMSKVLLIATQKAADPPVFAPDEGFLTPLRMNPGSVNYYSSMMNPDQRVYQFEPRGRVDIGQNVLDSRREQIIRAFYLDMMQMQQGPQMTATETVQRTEDRMRLMAPNVSRLKTEFLDPLIERVFSIFVRKGLLPDAPEAMEGLELRIEYVSEVVKAQQMSRVAGVQRLLESLAQIAPVKPEVFDKINADGVVEFLADHFDATYKILNSKAEVAKIREERQKQIEQAKQAEMMNKDSSTALNVAKTMEAADNGNTGQTAPKAG